VLVLQGGVSRYPLGRNALALVLGGLPDAEQHWYRVEVYDPDGSPVASRQLASRKLADRARDGFVHRAGKVPAADLPTVDWQGMLDAVPID